MKQNEALELYRRTGAYLEGHFRLSSGLHSPGYMQSALVLQNPADAASLGSEIAAAVSHLKPTVVLSPALGGLIIGHEVARALGVRAIFAERAGGTALSLRRGFSLDAADRVLVVEDVFTTGKSTRETMVVAQEAGAASRRSRGDRRSQRRHDRLRRTFAHARQSQCPDIRSRDVPALCERPSGGEAGIDDLASSQQSCGR